MSEDLKIPLETVLDFEDLAKVKVRFNLRMGQNRSALEIFDNGEIESLMEGQYWNYEKKKSYEKGQITVGFARYEDDLWLLFHVGKVIEDFGVLNGVGYSYEQVPEYQKYVGRLVVRFKNKSQNLVRKAESVFGQCEVSHILPNVYDSSLFPGYENVYISWSQLKHILKKEGWRVALQNQKGVYLITDKSNGKMYVGSAYGDQMILGRWENYASSCHGGNTELWGLDKDHIQNNFMYSILEIFKSTIADNEILKRESWWKTVLQSRHYGYNHN
jgi:hypothetical protein